MIKLMKNFIKENWFKIWLLVIFVISIVGAFYWFQLRPARIRNECSQYLREPIKASSSGRLPEQTSGEVIYKKCLLEYGLEK